MEKKYVITVSTLVKAPVKKVWLHWTDPGHITNWCFASNDWHAPKAENDLRTGGKFSTRMEARDGSMGFNFAGEYNQVKTNELIEYTLEDGRKVSIVFEAGDHETKITETFEAETETPVEIQRDGWQAILDNFKKYTEAST